MKSIELFAGAGGLGIGLHHAGFHPIKVIEWDRDCCNTIRINIGRGVAAVKSWPLFEGDVRSISFKQFAGNLDLISGGPPCQPFSLGGKHQAHADTRDMFPEAIRAVREAQPKALIFENVKGLTRASFSNYFEYIRLQLEHPNILCLHNEDWNDHLKRLERHHTSGVHTDLHYNVVARVVNAANYGVPEKRERVFFVGFRDDLGIEWNFPEETHSLDALIWSQLTDGSYWDHHKISHGLRLVNEKMSQRVKCILEKPKRQPWRTIRDAISDLPNPENELELSRTFLNHRFQPGARVYKGHTGSHIDEPAKTLKAGVHGVPGGENVLTLPMGKFGTLQYVKVQGCKPFQTTIFFKGHGLKQCDNSAMPFPCTSPD